MSVVSASVDINALCCTDEMDMSRKSSSVSFHEPLAHIVKVNLKLLFLFFSLVTSNKCMSGCLFFMCERFQLLALVKALLTDLSFSFSRDKFQGKFVILGIITSF